MSDENHHEELMDVLRTILKVQALAAVRDLPTKKDKILFLNEGGLSHAEVSMIVDTSAGAVRQTVYEANKRSKGS